MCAQWRERKHQYSLEHTEELFVAGKVADAPRLGHAEAEGMMAQSFLLWQRWCGLGSQNGVQWARMAASGGDRYRPYFLGCAYHTGVGGLSLDFLRAKEWYEKAAGQFRGSRTITGRNGSAEAAY